MNRDDAVTKVRDLTALARSTRFPEERSQAERRVQELRSRFAITDSDLSGDDVPGDLFGVRIGFYWKQISPHVDSIVAEMEKAAEKIGRLDAANQAVFFKRFYDDVRALVDTRAAGVVGRPRFARLKERRDEAIRAYYREMAVENVSEREADDPFAALVAHMKARDWTAVHLDMRKDAVERIVGVFEKDLLAAWQDGPAAAGPGVFNGPG